MGHPILGDVGGEFLGEVGAEHGAGVFDEAAEVVEGCERARGKKLVFGGAGDGVPGADAGGESDALQRLHGGLADAAGGRVDDAGERDGVVRVEHQLHVAEDVLDFGAVVEGEAADHVVLDLVAAQRLFHQARLRVGAVEDGAAGKVFRAAGSAEVLLDAVGDEEGFVLAVGGFVVADERAALARGEERLALALGVVGDDGGGAFKDDLRGAVVLFEANGADLGEVFFELEDVLDVGAAPAIDGLVFVADDADVVRRSRRAASSVRTAGGWCPGTRR